MFLLSFVSVLAVLLTISSILNTAEASGCEFVAKTSSIDATTCLGYQYIYIDSRKVPLDTHDMRIQLEEPSREIHLYCGKYNRSFSWNYTYEDANQIRVSFSKDYLRMKAYWCDSFDGPKKAGIHCAVEAFSTACPGRVGDNHICVYAVETLYFSSYTVHNAVEELGEVAAQVWGKAKVSVGVSHRNERTVVNTYSVERRSYIAIPAGYRFCSFSEVHSEEYYLAATGSKWRCKAPTFLQTNMVNGRCTNLPLCETENSPCPTSDGGAGAKPAVAQLFAILLFYMTYSC